MMTSLDCVPCLTRQIIEASHLVSSDQVFLDYILRDILRVMSESDFTQTPPFLAQGFHRRLREITGNDDPYRELKARFNAIAVPMLDTLTKKINGSPDPLTSAIKLSIAGNVIDSGAKNGLSEIEIRSHIDVSLDKDLAGDIDTFLQSLASAENILYIADNAGEIVFDRLLIEKIGLERVTLAVRGFPILNDATIADAQSTGLDKILPVIDNGSDAPGTILETCSDEFRKCFEEADLVIAKGQGNYETLCDGIKQIFFLLNVKCAIIAEHTGFPVGSNAIIKSKPKSTGEKRVTVNNLTLDIKSFTCIPIGVIHSEHVIPSKTPIQPIYASGCRGHLEVFPEYAEGLKDLEGFSHIYYFPLHRADRPKLIIKPFLQDVERGVFATARPQGLILSV